jgi:hypothetical protein
MVCGLSICEGYYCTFEASLSLLSLASIAPFPHDVVHEDLFLLLEICPGGTSNFSQRPAFETNTRKDNVFDHNLFALAQLTIVQLPS